jgi:D-tyrosyl-tRNA(Tyr) deacylase
VIQRVNSASVKYDNEEKFIGKGILIFLGIKKNDNEEKIFYLTKKILNLRIFENEKNKMDKSVLDIKGDVMIISEFTLYGDCEQGNRPDFILAEKPDLAERLYNRFVEEVKKSGLKVETGKFKSYMQVKLVNDGPVTFILEV